MSKRAPASDRSLPLFHGRNLVAVKKSSKAGQASQKVAGAQRSVPAVTRAIAALRLLGTCETPLGVNAIASRLNVVPSTALHILRVLVQEELVSFDPVTKGYSIDAGILTLAQSVLRPGNFGHRIQKSLEQLSRKYSVTLQASRIVGLDHMIVVASCSSTLPLRLHVEVGSRFPALMSATGRCVAAFQSGSTAELRKRFAKIRWDAPPTFDKWMKEVGEAGRRRYSVDRGNYLSGVTIVAAPVLDQSRTVQHVIVALGLNEQMNTESIKALAKDLTILAEQFSES